MLGGQEQKKDIKSAKTGLTGLETGLTGPSGSSAKIPSNKSKARLSFEELLAKYDREGAVQKQKRRQNKVNDIKPSLKHQEQSDSYSSQGNPCYMPLKYSMMHM